MSRPSPTPAPRRRALGRLAALAALVAAGACTEKLESGIACPALCPDQNVAVLDTIIEVVTDGPGTAADSGALDVSLAGFPGIGQERSLLLADRVLNGVDTLRTWAVIRFDSLTQTFRRGGTDSTIYAVDSVYLQLQVDTVSARRRVPGPVLIEVFDVDTAVTNLADTAAATLTPLFRLDRRIGWRIFAPEELRDSVIIPLDTARVRAKITATERRRLRVGVRASANGAPVQLRIGSQDGGRGARLNFDPSPDTAVHPVREAPRSVDPAAPELFGLAQALRDFTLILDPMRGEPDPLLQVGGVPGRRTFLRFDIPADILDSSTVIRATLLLTQRPDPRAVASDTVTIQPLVVLAGPRLDVRRAASVLDYQNMHGLDSLRLPSAAGGERSLEIVSLIRGRIHPFTGEAIPGWSAVPRSRQQHAITFVAVREGELPVEALFYSSEASNPALRPRLRLSYVPSTPLGTR